MASTLASVLLLLFSITSILILVTVLDWFFSLPSLDPARLDVRNLLIALQDLLLPLGSLPSSLLRLWSPNDLDYEANLPVLVPSSTPAPRASSSKHGGFPPSRSAPGDGEIKAISSTPSNESIPHNGGAMPTVMVPMTIKTLIENASKVRVNALPTRRTSIRDGSEPRAKFSLTRPTPYNHGSTSSAKPALIRRPAHHAKLTSTPPPSFTNLIPGHGQSSGSRNSVEEPVFKSHEPQRAPNYQVRVADFCNEVSLPKKTAAENASLKNPLTVVGEEQAQPQKTSEHVTASADFAHKMRVPEHTATEVKSHGNASSIVGKAKKAEQQEDQSTVVQEEELQKEHSTAVEEEVRTESQTFEKAIREIVDPDGKCGPGPEKLVGLLRDVMKRQAEAEQTLSSEKVRFQRTEEDLRHTWMDMRETFERIVGGQNEEVQSFRDENDQFYRENKKLSKEVATLKEKSGQKLDEYNYHLRNLNAEKTAAETSEQSALASVNDRINAEIQRHEKEKSAADFQHFQEKNLLLCSRTNVRNDLIRAQGQLKELEKQHEAVVEEKDRIIRGLKADLRSMEPALAAVKERAASKKQQLKKQLEDQCKEKDGKIDSLKAQLDKSREEAKSLSGWKAEAKAQEQGNRRLLDRLDEQVKTSRENREHVVGGLKLDISGLERTIRNNEAEITGLQGRVAQLESGEEVQSLRSQLRGSKKQLQRSAKDTQDLRQQLQDGQRKTEELQNAIKAREDQNSEAAAKASKEKDELNLKLQQAAHGLEEEAQKTLKEKEDFKSQLEQAARAFEEGVNKKAQELVEQKNALSSALEAAQSAERMVRTGMQGLQDEQRQTASEHERTVNGKDQEIRELRQALQDMHHAAEAKAREADAVKARGHEEEKKAVVEKAAKEAAEGMRLTLQKQLDDERQSAREAQEKATKTENELRNEMEVFKSQANKVPVSQADNSASSQLGKEAQEVAILTAEAKDANCLLLEIGHNGLVEGSTEQAVLCEYMSARIALLQVKHELQKPQLVISKETFVKRLDGVHVDEDQVGQLPSNSLLVREAKIANARLRSLEKILATNADVQKDAILEALNTKNPFAREIKKPRVIRRLAKADASISPGQPQQTKGTFIQQDHPRLSGLDQSLQPQPQAVKPRDSVQGLTPPKPSGPANRPVVQPEAQTPKDNRRSFMEILSAVSLEPVDADPTSADQEPAAKDQTSLPGLQGNTPAPRSPEITRSKPNNDHENNIAEMPVGWTDEMTKVVKDMHGEDIAFIEETVKSLHGLQTKDDKGLEKWLKKLKSDFEPEKNPPQLS